MRSGFRHPTGLTVGRKPQVTHPLTLGAGCSYPGGCERAVGAFVVTTRVFSPAMRALYLPQNNSLSILSDLSYLKYCFTGRQGSKLILRLSIRRSYLTCTVVTEAQLHCQKYYSRVNPVVRKRSTHPPAISLGIYCAATYKDEEYAVLI